MEVNEYEIEKATSNIKVEESTFIGEDVKNKIIRKYLINQSLERVENYCNSFQIYKPAFKARVFK